VGNNFEDLLDGELVAGLIFRFNSAAMAAIPVALAYVTKARRPEQAAMFGAAFVAAMLTMHVLLGAIAAIGRRWIEAAIGNGWNLAIGPLLIVLGLMWPGWLRVRLSPFAPNGRPVRWVLCCSVPSFP
jgi:cytochrome c-type biogenesis protein